MPNWVHNAFTVTGEDPQLDAIRQRFAGDESPLSFNTLIPRPAEHDEDWYNWNTHHWGTKWDACSVDVEQEPGVLRYWFNTAWSPPLPFVEAFAKTYADLDCTFDYEEEQGWGGQIVVADGELVSHDQYDIPESHAEMVRRGRECFCDDEDAVFDDCFSFRVEATPGLSPETIEAGKALGRGWNGTFEDLLGAATRL